MAASEILLSQNSIRPWPWFSDNGHSDDLFSLAMIRYKIEELIACLRRSEEMGTIWN
jgi:hypothetical protein